MHHPGFSIIEIVIAAAILAMLSLAIGSFTIFNYRTARFADEQREAIKSARQGIDTMVKEIRSARSGDDGSYAIQAAEDFSVTFFSDNNNDNKTEYNKRR